MSELELFHFSESSIVDKAAAAPWKVLSVEDDLTYQASLVYSLQDLVVYERPVQILTANSVSEAADVISRNSDISVILLDVVMEEDDAGLRLASTIREVLGNSAVRIILVTGQPGMAPRHEVMAKYDIDEYWNKSDLARDTLHTVVSSHIRTWRYLSELIQAKQGLQMVVDAARSISSKQNLVSFTETVLNEIERIIGIKQGGIVCFAYKGGDFSPEARILAASGIYSGSTKKTLSDLQLATYYPAFIAATEQRSHLFDDDFTVLHFDTPQIDETHYILLVNSNHKLTDSHINLLQVFSENINSGFTAVALVNRLSDLAYRDQVLKSYNRNWLLRELSTMPAEEKDESSLIILVVNDFTGMMVTFGERYCEKLLSALLVNICDLHPNNLIARTGDFTFAILLNKESMLTEEQLLNIIDQRLMLNHTVHRLRLTVARVNLNLLMECKAEQILQLSESTANMARLKGQRIIDYEPDIMLSITASHHLLMDLHSAIDNHEFFIVLQPKVNMTTGATVGFEALLRWRKPDGQIISPTRFIPLAETAGLISHLDIEAARHTIEAATSLQKAGFNLPISFNASCADLNHKDYIESLLNMIVQSGLDGQMLEIEVTESQAMQNYEYINPVLKQFSDRGIGVSIDDFGTGYSSLAHVANLKATTLKIDKSFIDHLGESAAGNHVVDMVLHLGKKFGFVIIAEGVETEIQRQHLVNRGCHIAQGYLFSKPMPVSNVVEWLQVQPKI
ncbi:EAL domain-containing protein [Neptuniibacter sp. 2_MG-2023]|uniref:EAL domain-containing protein n=1 Tax=Neptuniibacter sp. 2_MG-2023 TaxID=3062671 RepID=UPI0026E1B023|nr:EAL domain-containing protein [Neptuniibacter sp. 2_MG-2023]MDO6514414.1 EAL domain-containing protein [Neptuniibacter sp. 2_MG-2023]